MTYIPLARVEGFALGDAKNLHPTQKIPTCIFALGDTKVPNANGFASQW